jgi:hypothetical protein
VVNRHPELIRRKSMYKIDNGDGFLYWLFADIRNPTFEEFKTLFNDPQYVNR